MTKSIALGLVLACAVWSACEPDKPPPQKEEVSFKSLEDARAQARANATENAQAYRTAMNLVDYELISRGDSTQTNECPQGDGWATNELHLKRGVAVTADQPSLITLKCSTVSGTLGCIPEADFKARKYAKEDGSCAPPNRVPFPIPKLSQ